MDFTPEAVDVACELYSESCEKCELRRCPDDISRIKLEHQLLKDSVQKAADEMARQSAKLARFEYKYEDVVG